MPDSTEQDRRLKVICERIGEEVIDLYSRQKHLQAVPGPVVVTAIIGALAAIAQVEKLELTKIQTAIATAWPAFQPRGRDAG